MDEILAKHERETAARQYLANHKTALAKELEGWEQAERIRRYVAAHDACIAQGAKPSDGYDAWRADTLKVADSLDPLLRRLSV